MLEIHIIRDVSIKSRIFSIKYKIFINFVELFDSKTLQRLLHSSFVPKKKKNKKNIRLFLQKFDRITSYHSKKKPSLCM